MCPRLSIGTAKPGTKTIANFAHFADDLGTFIFIKRLFCHNISTYMAAYDYCIGECKTYYTYLSMPDDQTMDSKVSDFMDLK